MRAVSERHRRATTATLRIAFLSSTALEVVATISVALVAVIAGVRLAAGDLDLHTGLLAILLAPEAYWPVRRVGAEFHAAADGALALDTVLGRLERPAGVTTPPRRPGALVLDDLTISYAGRPDPVLEHLCLTIPAGPGLTVLTGPSGAGKTTLLEVVAGLREPTAGTVEGPAAHLVAQRPFLLPGTVRSNLLLGSGAAHRGLDTTSAPTDDDLWAALRVVGLDTVVADREGLDTAVGDDGTGWSAGQRARLVLSRALLSTAPLLLLDEPTAHVDADTRDRLDDVVADLARTRCVVAVAHRAGLVDRADHRLVLADGQLTRRSPLPTGARS